MLQTVLVFLLSVYLFALPISLGVMEMASSLLCIIGLVLMVSRQKTDWRVPVGFWPALGLFTVGVISAFQNDLPQKHLIHGIGKLRWVFVYYFIFNLMREINFPVKFKKLLPYFTPLVGLVAFFAFTQFWTGLDLLRDENFVFSKAIDEGGVLRFRSIGFFNNPLTYGYVYSGFFCILFAQAARVFFEKGIKNKFFLLYSLTSLIVFASIVTSYSRGVWIALAFGILVAAYFINKKLVKILLVLGPIFVVALALADSDFQNRITSVVNFQDNSNSERIEIWRANWAMFKDHPWLGVGYEYNDVLIGKYFDKLGIVDGHESHAHNDYLQFLVGTGIFGLLFYLGFIFVLLKKNYNLIIDGKNKYIAIGTLTLFVTILVGNLTECAFKDAEINHTFIFFASLIASLARSKKNSRLKH